MMPDKFSQAELECVRNEAVIMKHCSIHRNVGDVYGYCSFQKGSEPYIVMELMHWSLHRIIHEDASVDFSFRSRIKLIRDIASALEFLHLQRYIHQDVKPSNILVDQQCTIAKLTDFGVAERKGFYTTRTRRHSTILTTVLQNSGKKAAGTLAYQAPELILENISDASREAEIYSFGVTMWECVTRTIPHCNKRELHITTLARHSTKLMLAFPLKLFLEDKNLSEDDRAPFELLEKVAYLSLSKHRPVRPNATQIVQYLDETRQFHSQFLMVAPLSKWYNNSIPIHQSRTISSSNDHMSVLKNDNIGLVSTNERNETFLIINGDKGSTNEIPVISSNINLVSMKLIIHPISKCLE
jgi:serine/threonine protein kinase